MIYPEADKLENWGSKFGLVVLAAKRAKQLKAGARPLIDTDSRNALTVALEEIAAGKVMCEIADTDALLIVAQEPEVAQLLAIPERMDEDLDSVIESKETPIIVDDSSHEVLKKEDEEEEEDDEIEEEEDDLAFHEDEDEEDSPIVVDPDAVDLTVIPPTEEGKPKRGRRKAVPADPDVDVDLGIELPDIEADLAADIEIDLDDDDNEDKEHAEEEE